MRALVQLVVVSVFAGLGASASQTPAAQRLPAVGLIAGKVVEAGSDRPVAEAIVTLSGAGDIGRRVMVDGQGRFVFAGLAAGKYRVEAEQFGYLRGQFGRLRPQGDALQIDLADGQRLIDANVLMWRLVSIAGRVLDEAGEPVVGVSVRPLRRSLQLGQVVLTASFDGYRALTTDDRGVYRASMLPPGDYAIAVPARVSTFPVDVVRGIPGSGVSLGITETAPLGDFRNLTLGSNVLTTTSRMPIPPARDGAPVTVYQTTFYPGSTSVDGATVLSLSPGESRTGVDVRLVATSTMRVSGRILGPDGPLPLTTFKLTRADGAKVSDSFDFEVATGITDARGQFTLLGVPRGSYVLRVRTSRPPGNVAGAKPVVLSAEQRVIVGDTEVVDVEVSARWAAAIAGHIDIRGKPLLPAALTLIVETVGPGPSTALNIRPDKDFRFRVEVVPGRYLVWAIGDDVSCVSTSGGRVVSDDLLDVAGENIEDIAIVCGDPPTRLSGAVRDDKGQPDPRARVLVFSTDRRHWMGSDYRPRRDVSVRSTTTGTFSTSDLPPGDYFVVAIPDAAAVEWELPAVRDALIPSATRISLAAGATRAIDLRTAVVK